MHVRNVEYKIREVNRGQIIKGLVLHVPWEVTTLESGHVLI